MSLFKGEGPAHTIGKIVLRSLQFVLGLTVAGIYGNHVRDQQSHKQPCDSSFVFAVVTGGASCITALIYIIPKVKAYYAFIWDWILTIFWLAVFGKFAALFLNRDPNNPKQVYESTNTQQMKNCVWIDLINLALWAFTALYGTVVFLQRRRAKKDVEAGGEEQYSEMADEKPRMAKYGSRSQSPVSPLRPEEMHGALGGPVSPIVSRPPPIRWSRHLKYAR